MAPPVKIVPTPTVIKPAPVAPPPPAPVAPPTYIFRSQVPNLTYRENTDTIRFEGTLLTTHEPSVIALLLRACERTSIISNVTNEA